ncbi:YbaB/EbfC family nucleoid-associated protein [Nocardia vinacea]|uniref:YbaB/EbfC family nucleoid-associated protein n=1 Tax=Nocardia vinacea TaxID=96468 RepID=A0ABZ1YRE6_9NOCA|nr:YbaB/EbfC family nucleoid-associated protein [Nocardia vinacea]
MEQWESDGPCSAGEGMRNQINHILDTLAEQRAHVTAVREKLAAVRSTTNSADGLVEVTVDGSGVLVDVKFAPKAFGTGRRELARSVTEAGQEAARLARVRNEEIIAPITAAAAAMPDLPDLLPGAPSLRELRGPRRHAR